MRLESFDIAQSTIVWFLMLSAGAIAFEALLGAFFFVYSSRLLYDGNHPLIRTLCKK